MNNKYTDSQIVELIDRSKIEKLIYQYCRGSDRGDIPLLKSLYHDDAVDNHGMFDGNAHEFIDSVVPKVQGKYSSTQHHITNIILEFHGDVAYGESYFVSYHRWRSDPSRDSSTGGRYIDRFEKRDGQWRIAFRQLLVDWTADHMHLPPTESEPLFMRGETGEADWSNFRLPEHRKARV